MALERPFETAESDRVRRVTRTGPGLARELNRVRILFGVLRARRRIRETSPQSDVSTLANQRSVKEVRSYSLFFHGDIAPREAVEELF